MAEPTLIFVHFLGRGSYKEFTTTNHHISTQTIVSMTCKSSFIPGRQLHHLRIYKKNDLAWLPLVSQIPPQGKTRGQSQTDYYCVINCIKLLFDFCWEEPHPPVRLTVYVLNRKLCYMEANIRNVRKPEKYKSLSVGVQCR